MVNDFESCRFFYSQSSVYFIYGDENSYKVKNHLYLLLSELPKF